VQKINITHKSQATSNIMLYTQEN